MLSNHAFDGGKNRKQVLLDTDILQEAMADLVERPGMRPPPGKFLKFSCSFRGGNAPNNRFASPPLGLVSSHPENPAFATGRSLAMGDFLLQDLLISQPSISPYVLLVYVTNRILS